MSDAELSVVSPAPAPQPMQSSAKSSHSQAMPDYTLTFDNLQYKIADKNILCGVTGEAKSGRLLAILGPSGAGKTTFLHLLAGRLDEGEIKGEVCINNVPRNKAHKKLVGFVTQHDHLFGMLSVRESLDFSARLRLPPTVTEQERSEKIDSLISLLNLEKCQNSYIGGALVRGISGGETKRTAIGVELITDPTILFLDEPTSGLDSFMAHSVMSALVRLARNSNRMIICTIHQPSSAIFNMFDDVLLLSHGHTMYFGPARQATDYFASINVPCPSFMNPAEFMLEFASRPAPGFEKSIDPNRVDVEAAMDGLDIAKPVAPSLGVKELAEMYRNSSYSVVPMKKKGSMSNLETAAAAVTATNGAVVASAEPTAVAKPPRNSFGSYTRILTHRAFLLFFRNKRFFRMRLAQIVFMALIASAVYYNIDETELGMRDREGVVFFILMQIGMGGMASVLHIFFAERAVVNAERDGRIYPIGAYYLGKTVAELPLQVLEPVLYTVIVYYTVDLRHDPGHFFRFVLIVVSCGLCGQGTGLMLATAMPSYNIATLVMGIVMILMILFSGFFVATSHIPIWLRWLRYLSPVQYGFSAGIVNELQGRFFSCTSGEDGCLVSGSEEINNLGVPIESVWVNIIILLALAIGFRFIAYLCLRFYRPKGDDH